MFKRENEALKTIIDIEEQHRLMNEIEVSGLTQVPNENIIEKAKQVGENVGMSIKDEMIDTAFRLRITHTEPRRIIVKFIIRLDKGAILRKGKVKRYLSTRHMGLPQDGPIYIWERLSQTRRALLKRAWQAATPLQYKFV